MKLLFSCFLLISTSLFANNQPLNHSPVFEMYALDEITPIDNDESKNFISTEIGQIYHQGLSNFCWGYASFFAVRSYNLYTNHSPNFRSWDQAINKINSASGLRRYVSSISSTSQGGLPQWFFNRFQNGFRLPSQGWQIDMVAKNLDEELLFCGQEVDLKEFDNVSVEDNSEKSSQKIIRSLGQGAPVVRCGNGHCVTIYGAYTNNHNTVTSLLVADSRSMRQTYRVNANNFLRTTQILVHK